MVGTIQAARSGSWGRPAVLGTIQAARAGSAWRRAVVKVIQAARSGAAGPARRGRGHRDGCCLDQRGDCRRPTIGPLRAGTNTAHARVAEKLNFFTPP